MPSSEEIKAAVELEDFGRASLALRVLIAGSSGHAGDREVLARALSNSGTEAAVRAAAELYRATSAA